MEKLTFPTDILPGLVFNDFINQESLLHTYAPFAVTIKRLTDAYALIMDDMGEIIHIDRQNTIPQWISYYIHRQSMVLKLNQFISSKMNCVMKGVDYQLYRHPIGICVMVVKCPDNVYTYLLYRD